MKKWVQATRKGGVFLSGGMELFDGRSRLRCGNAHALKFEAINYHPDFVEWDLPSQNCLQHRITIWGFRF